MIQFFSYGCVVDSQVVVSDSKRFVWKLENQGSDQSTFFFKTRHPGIIQFLTMKICVTIGTGISNNINKCILIKQYLRSKFSVCIYKHFFTQKFPTIEKMCKILYYSQASNAHCGRNRNMKPDNSYSGISFTEVMRRIFVIFIHNCLPHGTTDFPVVWSILKHIKLLLINWVVIKYIKRA